MYLGVSLFQATMRKLGPGLLAPSTSSGPPRLLLARRQTLVGPYPQEQSGFGVANGPAELDVGRAVAAHTRLGQPR